MVMVMVMVSVCLSRVRHGILPANTLVQAGLVGEEYLVEIEVEAELLPSTATAITTASTTSRL